ncbi:MAG: hypothetical protein M1827_004649 [Pycnora praestabilis]|nr:MAG: hypothetical protein M1827_004649 [Pycnora praestabilis]
MSGFFGKLRGSSGATSPLAGSSPAKKDQGTLQQTPLEKLLADAGPVRNDGSDKFFGMENFGSTCYCNSILQCLYYSVPFREQVMNYPTRSPIDSLNKTSNGLLRLNTDTAGSANGTNSAMSSTRLKSPITSPLAPARKATQAAGIPGQAGTRPEDVKDSPEYKKKQAMLAGPILAMDYENARNYGMPESLFTSLKDIFEAIVANQSRTGIVSPQRFLETLKSENENFRGSMHQDAHEFLNLLLNEVVANVEAYSRKIEADRNQIAPETDGNLDGSAVTNLASALSTSNGSRTSSSTDWVHELFEGTLTSETKCLTCENVSQRDEAFLDLSVDLDQHSSVTSCLRKFSEEEMLCERNKFHCDKCGGLQEAEKRMKIKRLPKILALHLKRFKYTEDLQRLQKLFHRVVYPYHLRLFNTTDDAEDPDRLYELYAVVVHIGGGPYHGHYVSIVKTQGRGWLLFDDEMVEPVDKSYVRNFFGEKPGLACAYVLFYQETTLEAVQREQEAEGLAQAAQASEGVKDGVTIPSKSNGISANGLLHHVQTVSAPLAEETDQFASLNHAATAPMQSPSLVHRPAMAEVLSKKERAKEEKERKAMEKEKEKAEKQRRKDSELKRKEYEKRQSDDVKAAMNASMATKAEEDQKLAKGSGKENGPTGMMSGSLSRFRQSSKSIKGKPKLWGVKDKDERQEPKQSPDAQDVAVDDGETSIPTALPAIPPTERPKSHRFSLKKKSSNPLS